MCDMRITHKLFVLIILFSLSVDGQARQVGVAIQDNITLRDLNEIYFDNKYYSVKSSLPEEIKFDFQKHLFEDERETLIYTIQGDTLSGRFRYNLQEEKLEAKDGKFYPFNVVAGFKFLRSDKFEEVTFSNLKLFDREGIYGGFLQDVGSSPLVKIRYYLGYVYGKKSTLPYAETSSDDRVRIYTEILIKLENKIVVMPDTKKAFFDLFPEKADELKDFAKKNKLKINDPEDIGQMVAWVKNGN